MGWTRNQLSMQLRLPYSTLLSLANCPAVSYIVTFTIAKGEIDENHMHKSLLQVSGSHLFGFPGTLYVIPVVI